MGTLVEQNSELAVEDLSWQNLSESKLCEVIQEARVSYSDYVRNGCSIPLSNNHALCDTA